MVAISRKMARLLLGLANNYMQQGRYAEAEALYRRLIAIPDQEQPQSAHPAGYLLNQLGAACAALGNQAEAEILYQRALISYEQEPGLIENWALALEGLVDLYSVQGRWSDAEVVLQERLGIVEALHQAADAAGNPRPWPDAAIIILLKLVRVLVTRGKFDVAEPAYQKLVSLYEQRLETVTASERSVLALGLANGVAHVLQGYAAMLRELSRSQEATMLDMRAAALRAEMAEQRLELEPD